MFGGVGIAILRPRGSDFERKRKKKIQTFFFLKYELFPTHFSGTAAPL